ncbi:DNA mismatch repair ATPase MutS [Geosmithia morbida]|uniref:DNA mismatch repair ATPase MutS n=1 Tax=Geosmithia morbida TaxID=1094350 RepID=A0A9P5D595_9HYPO|nr:DNA mismatch repair ATPase MutS [Geosmithia morbida]KAF4123560.1 DNA mismatch repair ATPase MutS [Geosmithia morbida]
MLRVYGARWPGKLLCRQREFHLTLSSSLDRHHRSIHSATRVTATRAGHFKHQIRGKKTKTTVNLADLPQGLLPRHKPTVINHDTRDEPAYPTVVLQARRNMQKFDNCVLLTRVGGFYELYFEHADEYGPLLNLKVASKKTSAGPVPMAGFPFFQLDRFLKILVQDLNRYVAIAEEFPNEASEKVKSGGLMHNRRVSRIITPGTLIDENFMDPYANNYVMAIHVGQHDTASNNSEKQSTVVPDTLGTMPQQASLPLGLAWLDVSTGHFFIQATDLASLPAILSRVNPREVVLDQSFGTQKDHGIFSILAEDRYLITYATAGTLLNPSGWTPYLESDVPASTRDSLTQNEVLAGDLVLNYVKDRLQGLSMKLQPPLRHENMDIMTIDKNSLRALEIKQTMRDGFFKGSLLHAIRRTVTKSGARLLNEWLGSPSTSLDVIKKRQDVVAHFIDSPDIRDSIINLLQHSHDSQRLVQKFALGRGDPDDLLGIAYTIRATKDIVALLEEDQHQDCLKSLTSRINLDEPLKLAARIRDAIDEEGILNQHEMEESTAGQMMVLAENIVSSEGTQEDASSLPKGRKKRPASLKEHYAEDNESWIMKPAASLGLQKLHADLVYLQKERISLTETLRERFQASSMTLRWTPGLGHIAHIKGKDLKHVTDVRSVSSSRSTRSFHLPEWTSLGQRLDQVRFQIRVEEQRVFQSLREHVVVNLVKIRHNAAVLDELDITTSFANLAVEKNLVRPQLNNSTAHTIIGGRHPTVEGGLYEQGRSFVRNDCLVGMPTEGRLWLITGPNMAGKSTFLRQNALITILAQVGCYVPASFAEIGIVDAIFSRVGSADNLYRDQSTFMVEMIETAQILKHATPRSFVIMDEIGRGTTPEDGTAVSFACLQHLVTVNQCRTLFATHFHDVEELVAAEGLCTSDGGAVRFYCTDVDEDDQGGFVYIHKLRKGINRQSHALKVARMAGLPRLAIDTARRVLEEGTQRNEPGQSTASTCMK